MSFLSHSLPQELVDMIIDHLWNERSALGICGLVHRTWLPSSRYHLFYKVKLMPPDKLRFIALLRSPVVTFPPYVTDLSMMDKYLYLFGRAGYYVWEWVNDALPLMGGFSGVRCLVLSVVTWYRLGDASLLTLTTSLPNLMTLCFDGVFFDSFDELVNMVSVHPMLKTLVIDDTGWRNRPTTFIQYPPPLASLQHLTLISSCTEDIVTWILHHKSAYVNISSLDVKFGSADEIRAAAALVHNVGPSLRRLKLSLPWDICGCEEACALVMDLAQNSELRTLVLHPLVLRCTLFDARSFEWATTLLSRLNSHIEEIQICIVYDAPDALEVLDWTLIERILAGSKFSQLRHFTFCLHEVKDIWGESQVKNPGAAMTFIKKKLPRCDALGIIHFPQLTSSRIHSLIS